ncbi:MAG: hypothetical protein WDZ77_00980 [Candidatus Pacearchaeota archaeon]
MGALEQLSQMRNQGMDDANIIQNLQQNGFSQQDINNAFNQAQIKSAVSDNNEDGSLSAPSPGNNQDEEFYTPNPEPENQGQQGTYSQEQEYSSYQQPQEGDYSQPGGLDTGTIIEIAEQVFSEKMHAIQKTMEDVSEFKTLAESRMENILERIKRIEKTLDVLQVSILQRVGSYGSNLESIKKEMSMMQDSFGKALPGFAVKKHHETKNHKKTTKPSAKKKTTSKTKTRKKR